VGETVRSTRFQGTGVDRFCRRTKGWILIASLRAATEPTTLRPVSDEGGIHDEVRAVWDGLAPFWDERMTADATWQRRLIQPSVERLLQLRAGERVLEVACGNGEFARRMSELGADVLATDFSEGMLERARAYGGDVDYRSADATVEDELLTLGEPESFDAVVANMADHGHGVRRADGSGGLPALDASRPFRLLDVAPGLQFRRRTTDRRARSGAKHHRGVLGQSG
jgi:SAM-dependent methyltransferase